MRSLLPAALAVQLLTGLAQAEAEELAKTVGMGFLPCETWKASRMLAASATDYEKVAWPFEQWVIGFLSGVGWALTPRINPLSGVNGEAVWAWVDEYCRANPHSKISDAAMAFVKAHPH